MWLTRLIEVPVWAVAIPVAFGVLTTVLLVRANRRFDRVAAVADEALASLRIYERDSI